MLKILLILVLASGLGIANAGLYLHPFASENRFARNYLSPTPVKVLDLPRFQEAPAVTPTVDPKLKAKSIRLNNEILPMLLGLCEGMRTSKICQRSAPKLREIKAMLEMLYH